MELIDEKIEVSFKESDLKQFIRPNILSLTPYRCARDTIKEGLLLDANESPFEQKFQGILVNRYPDPHQLDLREQLSKYVGINPDQILAGNGSDEVLDWILKVFCSPGKDRVAITPPTYGMYRVTADIQGVEVIRFPLEPDFSFDALKFIKNVPKDVKVLILCSPNNPTGNLLDRNEILSVVSNWKGIVVVDEAYIEFAESESIACEVNSHPNLVVTRTFSKALGKAGLRLGYVVAAPLLIEFFGRVKMPYNLNSLTLSAGVEAIRKASGPTHEVQRIIKERSRVSSKLNQIKGIGRVYPSEANFILFECERATEIYEKLFVQEIVVRDRSSVPGLNSCLRVSIGTPEENDIFLNAIQDCIQEN